jgi:ABC-type multidrug transport system ATPase subunit
MITIDALRVRDGERTPLDGVTMLLTANAVHGIAGEGRSELLRAVYGLAVPESGSVTSGGHPLRRRDMAYLEAEPRFWPGLTAGDCLGLVRRYHPASDPAPLLRRLPVPPAAEAAALPPNERKRLALVLLLLNPKRVLLLDEPFRGLDVESAFMLRQLILQLGSHGARRRPAGGAGRHLRRFLRARRRGRPRPLRTLRIRSGGPGSGRFGDCGKMSTFTKNSMP